jgi:hypothetical protein
VTKATRQAKRDAKYDRYEEKGRLEAAQRHAAKRELDIREGRDPGPEPTGADTAHYDRH